MTTRKILLPVEAAALFGVDPKTLSRWARQEKVPHFRTPGGHRRYYEDEMLKLRTEQTLTWEEAL